MSIIGALDQTKHFSEFGNLLQTNEGFLTGEQRKKIARANLEIYGGLDIGVANPLMFGAVGDGIHDDTAAIQAMIAFGSPVVDWLNDGYTYLITDTLVVTKPYTCWIGNAKIDMNRTATWCKPMVIVMQSAHDCWMDDRMRYDHNGATTPAATRSGDLALVMGCAIMVMGNNCHFGGRCYNSFDVGIGFVSVDFTGDGSVATPYSVTAQHNGQPIGGGASYIYGNNCGCGEHTSSTGGSDFNQGAAVDILTASSVHIDVVEADTCFAGAVVDFNSQANGSFGVISTRNTKQDSRLPGGSGMGIYCGDFMTVGAYYSNNDTIGIVCYNNQWTFQVGAAFIWAPGLQGVVLAGGTGRFTGTVVIGAPGRTLSTVSAFTANANTGETVMVNADITVWTSTTGTYQYAYVGNVVGSGRIEGSVRLVTDGTHTIAPLLSNGNELISYIDTNGNQSEYSNHAGLHMLGGLVNPNSLAILQMVGAGIDFNSALPTALNYNLYWDGTNWRHTNTSVGILIRFEPGDTSITTYYAAAGTTGAVASLVQMTKFSATQTTFATPVGVPSGGTGTTTSTGSGSVVLNNGPTLIAPALGTPSSGVATNLTGLPLSTGVTGVLPAANGGTGGNGSVTGSGANVLANSPSLVSPALGIPSAAVLTNATGLPLTSGVTGTLPAANGGTGGSGSVTGTGANVLANGPTLTAPALGTPVSGVLTNLTGLPLTSGVTGVLPTANGGATAMGQGTSVMNGTWTPVLRFGGNTVGVVYSLQVGNYTRIGNLVFFQAEIGVSSKGTSTGAVTITGLPFTPPTQYSIGTMLAASGMSSWGASKAVIVPAASAINIYLSGSTGDVAAADTNFTNSSVILVQGILDLGSLT